ncbi:MAG: Lrp/AsnC family transcriptional regulator [Nanoarchaeota archaeon]|nr:Lrp/AsnC family transcriptional regulator [Nanoarchaeota archaeon]
MKKVKLDKKDKRILYELDLNARQPYSLIAKKVGLSQEVVRYRIERLQKNKVLRGFLTVFGPAQMGYSYHKIYIAFQNISIAKEKALTKFLREHDSVIYLASLDGGYDLAFSVKVKDMLELDKLVSQLDTDYGSYLNKRDVFSYMYVYYFPREYLAQDQNDVRRSKIFGAIAAPKNIDETDDKICRLLSSDARMPAIKIAAKIGLSADAIIKRIKKLEESGAIRCYITILNNEVLDQFHYKVLLTLKKLAEDKEKTFIEYCRRHPNVFFFVKTLGPWNYELDMELKDSDELRKIMREMKAKFSDVVMDYQALIVYKIHKYNILGQDHLDA